MELEFEALVAYGVSPTTLNKAIQTGMHLKDILSLNGTALSRLNCAEMKELYCGYISWLYLKGDEERANNTPNAVDSFCTMISSYTNSSALLEVIADQDVRNLDELKELLKGGNWELDYPEQTVSTIRSTIKLLLTKFGISTTCDITAELFSLLKGAKIPTAVIRGLKRESICTVEQFSKLTKKQLLKMKGVGEITATRTMTLINQL